MNEVAHSVNEQQLSHGNVAVEESDIPGFAYDSVTKRYYRVQPQASGPVSFLIFALSGYTSDVVSNVPKRFSKLFE